MTIEAWDQFRNHASSRSTTFATSSTPLVREIPPAAPLDARKRKSPSERREQIISAATRVIGQKGFWGMALQDVADDVGITEAGLYHYIRSKGDLLTMVLESAYDTREADEFIDASSSRQLPNGQHLYFFPRYCLNIVAYNVGRIEMVKLFATLNGEALAPQHPAHDYFVGRQRRLWNHVRTMQWSLPTEYDVPRFQALYTLAMSAMDGLQYQWLADDAADMLTEWLAFSDELFPEQVWKGFRDPTEATQGA